MENHKNSVIIVAGGSGTRMRASVPKQFLELAGKPILMHTMDVFYQFDNNMLIVVVLPADQHQTWNNLCEKFSFSIPHVLAAGGESRFHSVQNGLAKTPNKGIIAVHDGVRPLVAAETISRCFEAAKIAKGVIPVVPVTESVRLIQENAQSIPVDRDKFVLIQTPQVFDAEILHKAYQQPFSSAFTDDATVVEKLGIGIQLVEGNFENIKITRPLDLLIAEAIISRQEE